MKQENLGNVRLFSGDCLDVIPTLDSDSIDSCVTDPPYGLSFMGKNWDHGVPGVAFWKEVYRVLKPGAHLVAFGGTRTNHRMVSAIEDAGFEIRDSLMWVYGTGFPKSHDVSKGIDKAAVARSVTDAARQWEGWGTALKPAFEPIVLARKPLSEKTVAANVLRWGTGALNIGACRVGTTRGVPASLSKNKTPNDIYGEYGGGAEKELDPNMGRWPANVVHDGSDEVVGAFPNLGKSSGGMKPGFSKKDGWSRPSHANWKPSASQGGFGDSGSAARFFYSAKASRADRNGSKHPTVKPIALMQWLARLTTPPGGTVLDPFAGSGTTGAACEREGFHCILIEKEVEYQNDIRNRLAPKLVDAAE
jgi:site-specific DNA-methyltransferase (adenine-specific)